VQAAILLEIKIPYGRSFQEMKAKKILAIILSAIMIIGSMTTVATAEGTTEVSTNAEFVSALDAGSDVKIKGDFTVDTAIKVPDGTTIDLNGKTLYWNVENSYFGTSTVKNGNIVFGKDDVHVCDGYFLINESKTLTLDGVNITSSADGMKCYAVFHLKTGAAVDVKNSTIDVAKNEYAPGYVVYANEATAKADFTNSAVTTEDVAGVVHAATTITSSSFTIKGTEGTAMEHGINRSAVTITDSNVSISGGTGRGITPTHGSLVINGNSIVKIYDMAEASIELRSNQTITVADTSKVSIDKAVTAGSGTTNVVITGTVTVDENLAENALAGQGTEGNPYIIDDVEDLILFRDSVNAGETKYNADNVYIALGANIDMADVDWSVNIGDACNVTFDGIFDGKDYTISNLKSTETAQMSDGYICTGLFGAIGGNAVVKNFTVDGAIIDTANFTGNNAAVVVGFAWEATGSVENVTVKNAEINAAKVDGTGAIVGYAYGGELTVNDCEVYNSTVEGQAYVGGIIGYAGGKAALEANKIDAVTVTANSCAAGGVAGIMLGGSVATNNVVKSVTLSSVHENWLNATGVVAGTFTGNITVKGTETDSAETIVGVLHANKPSVPLNKAEGSVNGVYYAKYDDAVKAALAASGDVTITLNADVELSEPLVIDADDKITIDLNGFKINYNSTTQGEAMITNKGNLTIKDSGETGVINYNYTGAADPSYGKGNYTI
jgi:hypothetical protein